MSDLHHVSKFAERRRRNNIWRSVVTFVAALVVFCTTYALILPAITMETEGLSCGMEAHTHTEECCQLTCGKQEYFSHTHTEECYEEEELICPLEERTIHHHTDDCYSSAQPICGLSQCEPHAHSEGCYGLQNVLICGQSACEPHTHGESCYTDGALTCTLEETAGHTHTEECYEEQQALTCTLEETEGHTHTEECYPSDFEPKLICEQEDIPEHRHTEDCYIRTCEKEAHIHTDECVSTPEAFLQNQNVINPNVEAGVPKVDWTDPEAAQAAGYTLLCESTEEGHVHTETCYTAANENTIDWTDPFAALANGYMLLCEDMDESHIHTAACYDLLDVDDIDWADPEAALAEGYMLLCDNQDEIHTHTEACYDLLDVDDIDWADPEAAEAEGYTLQCESTEEDHVHTQECYDLTGDIDENEKPVTYETGGSTDPQLVPFTALTGVTGQVSYHPAEGGAEAYYFTSIVMNYATTKEQIMSDLTDGKVYYLDLKQDIVVVDPDAVYYLYDSEKKMTAGQFSFRLMGSGDDTYYRMLIDFSDDYLDQVTGAISGTMYFSGNVDASHDDEEGNFEVEVVPGKTIYVKSEDIIFNNKTGDNYDISIQKGHVIVTEEGTLPSDSDSDGEAGHVKLTYTVTVSSDKGTPGSINLTDTMSWSQPSDTTSKDCTLVGVKVDGAEVVITPGGEGQNREIFLQLDQLAAGKQHVIEYTYDFEFDPDIVDSILGVNNEVVVESKLKDGRPEEKVTASTKDSEGNISPPFGFPSIGKKGELNEADEKIEWRITFNENLKDFSMKEGGYTISDDMMKNQTSMKMYVDGVEVDIGDRFDAATGQFTIGTDLSGKKVELVYTTPRGDLGNFGTTATQSNTATYNPWDSNTYSSTASVTKSGGGFQKTVGTPTQSEDDVLIPWTITITPGLDGIPTGKDLTDTLQTDNQSFDADSLKVVYVDASGNELKTIQSSAYTSSFTDKSMTLQFTTDPFDKDESGVSVAPEGAVAVQVRYNSVLNEGVSGYQYLKNHSSFDTFTSEASIGYTPSNVGVTKEVAAGTDSEGNTVLTWKVWVTLNQGNQITTGIADSLKGAEGDETHYFIEDSVHIHYAGWGWQQSELDDSNYTVSFFKDGELPSLTGTTAETGKNTYMVIEFTNPPLTIPNGSNGILITYQTALDGTPSEGDSYRNEASVMNQNAAQTYTVPYDKEVKKTHGNYSLKNGNLSIPWTVDIYSKDGTITNPIRDSLRLDASSYNHFFDESVRPTLVWVDEWGYSKDNIPYTVTYYQDYTGDDLSTAQGSGGESGKNTYMEISLTEASEEGVYTIPTGGVGLRLTYNTITDGIPTSATTYKNEVYAVGKKAIDQVDFAPELPKVESKWATKDGIEVSDDGITIPWTVKIKRGTPVALTDVYDALYGNDLEQYYVLGSVTIEYANAYGGSSGVFVPEENYTIEFYPGYSKTTAEDGKLTLTPTGDKIETSGNATYMHIQFTTDPFASRDDTDYLLLHYSSKTTSVPTDSSEHYIKNLATVSGESVEGTASYASSKIVKRAFYAEGNYYTDYPVDVGTNKDGTLAKWEIQATTGNPGTATKLVVEDVLPKYVTLTQVEGGEMWQTAFVSFDAQTGTISGNNGYYQASGSYVKNTDGQYVLTIEISRMDRKAIESGKSFSFYLTPKVDVDNLPDELKGTKFSFSNKATVSYDGITVETPNASIQNWEHDYDVAEGSLSKSQYFEQGSGSLVYTVEFNPEGKDLEPDPDVDFVDLVDTLTYKDESFGDIEGLPGGYTLQRINLTLNIDETPKEGCEAKKLTLYYATKDTNGDLVKGEEVPASLWTMTTDRVAGYDQYGKHQIQNVIYLTVPDETPLILEYAYDVNVEYTPANEKLLQLKFTFEAENKVEASGHKNSSSTSGSDAVKYVAASGGGDASAAIKTLTIKKVDSANEAISLSGAKFDIQKYASGAWSSILGENYLVSSSDDGTIAISSDLESNSFALEKDVFYKVVEKVAPSGYYVPDSQTVVYFYLSGDNSKSMTLPDGISKSDATDLSQMSNTVMVKNTKIPTTEIGVEKKWFSATGDDITGSKTDPNETIQFELYRDKSETQPSSVGSGSSVSFGGGIHWSWTGGDVIKEFPTVTKPVGTTVTFSITYLWSQYNEVVPVVTANDVELVPTPEKGSWNTGWGTAEKMTYHYTITLKQDTVIAGYVSSGNKTDWEFTDPTITEPSTSGPIVPETAEKYGESFYTLSTANGWATTITNLPVLYQDSTGKTWYYVYYVKETTSTGCIVNYDNNGIGSGTITINNTQSDTPVYTLPETGGAGTTLYTAGGLLLILAAGIPLMYSQSKRRRGAR